MPVTLRRNHNIISGQTIVVQPHGAGSAARKMRPNQRLEEIIGMPRVAPQALATDLAFVRRLRNEALHLHVRCHLARERQQRHGKARDFERREARPRIERHQQERQREKHGDESLQFKEEQKVERTRPILAEAFIRASSFG